MTITMERFVSSLPAAAQVPFGLAVMLLAGFLVTRVTKTLRLPNVTGYILAGVLIGPCCLSLVPAPMWENMGFVSDIALAFIAFGVGKFFKASTLRRSGGRMMVLTVFESLTAAALVTATMYFGFGLSLSFSLLLGAIASATAPASTIMTIKQYKAQGDFVDTILQVVALDDAVSLIAFSVCAAVVQAVEGEGAAVGLGSVLLPVLMNLAAIALGIGLAWLLKKLTGERRSDEHRIVLVSAFLLVLTTFCGVFDISPLLSCMVMGTAFVNMKGNERVFKQVDRFTPNIYLLFFVLSGMRLDLRSLATAGVIGVVYFLVRIAGKYAGAWLGATVAGYPATTRKYLGLALIPQAGVSIGLAILGQRMLGGDTGTMLSTIILSSGVLYEMVGPACAKLSLRLSGSYEAPVSEHRAPRVKLSHRERAEARATKRLLHRIAKVR